MKNISIQVVTIINDLSPEYLRTPKPCIWLPRTWCLKNNVRSNQIISLTSFKNDHHHHSKKCFASVKLYSKYSALFRGNPIFPEKLKFSLLDDDNDNNNKNDDDDDDNDNNKDKDGDGDNSKDKDGDDDDSKDKDGDDDDSKDKSDEDDKYETQAIISKLLACNLNICEISGNLKKEEKENLKFPIKLIFHEVINNVPVANKIFVYSPPEMPELPDLDSNNSNNNSSSGSNSSGSNSNSSSNSSSNSIGINFFRKVHLGSLVSPNTWICQFGCNGMQYYKILKIFIEEENEENGKNGNENEIGVISVGRISDSTNIEIIYENSEKFFQFQEIYDNDNNVNDQKKFQKKSEWIEKINKKIGGLDNVIKEIIDQIHCFVISVLLPSNNNKRKFQIGVKKSKGILVTGKPGTGKTSLALCIAETSGLPYVLVNCPDLFKRDEGTGEREIYLIFESMQRHQVSLIILDEIDILTDASASIHSGVEANLYSIIIKLIDSINENNNTDEKKYKGKVFIIGLSNRIGAINKTLCRPGRLDRTYELIIKKPEQRKKILEILTKEIPFANEERDYILEKISKMTHGFVSTDLQYLCTQSIMQLIHHHHQSHHDRKNHITLDHFEKALQFVKPSNLNEFQIKTPDILFSDIYGIDEIIEDLKLTIIEPFNNPQEFIEFGISPPRGILIYGPSGVGKTMLCRAIAAETGLNFMFVECSQIRSKIVGESEKNISKIFSQAKSNSPCILFIDQIDILAPARGGTNSMKTTENTSERIVTSLLTEMDGFFTLRYYEEPEVDVLVISTTNRPEVLDPALLRPGRLDQHIYIPPPDAKQRNSILKGKFKKMPITLSEQQLSSLVQVTEGFSGADLDNLCREAALISIRENMNNEKISYDHLIKARSVCKASLLNYKPTHPFL
ncbi:hypothetical protein Glove_14g25 [Diversispora epigaea]|uniref:AAA+ ATPase domain-containing protein n=1 Tax=Diversispora epigaea TaxID=1348612 RepID=A0A397JTR7_9GLOM|nr:hypothetical protein Glove_14g25 [Diversispora epigaea]